MERIQQNLRFYHPSMHDIEKDATKNIYLYKSVCFVSRHVIHLLQNPWNERHYQHNAQVAKWLKRSHLQPWSTLFTSTQIDYLSSMFEAAYLDRDEIIEPAPSTDDGANATIEIALCVLQGRVSISVEDGAYHFTLEAGDSMTIARYIITSIMLSQIIATSNLFSHSLMYTTVQSKSLHKNDVF